MVIQKKNFLEWSNYKFSNDTSNLIFKTLVRIFVFHYVSPNSFLRRLFNLLNQIILVCYPANYEEKKPCFTFIIILNDKQHFKVNYKQVSIILFFTKKYEMNQLLEYLLKFILIKWPFRFIFLIKEWKKNLKRRLWVALG